jgi:hypothetical protein
MIHPTKKLEESNMSAISYERGEEESETQEHDGVTGSARPRRRIFGRSGAVLLALVLGVVGFYAGIRVEKGQLSGSTSPSLSLPSSSSTSGAAGSSSRTTGTSRSGFPGAGGFGGGNTSIGTVSSVKGKTIYMTDTSGNTLKVALSSVTKITKSLHVARKAVRPGDSVVIQGAKSNNGTLRATSVADSGASTTATASTSSSNSSNASGPGVSSLFSAGGG